MTRALTAWLRSPHRREHSLTALVVLVAVELFVMAPLAAEGQAPIVLELAVAAGIVLTVLAIVWESRHAVTAVALATAVESVAFGLRVARPSARTEALDFVAALLFVIALTVVLAFVVFAPGRVSIHRILGAITIYLNVGAVFALAYRVIDGVQPNAFSHASVGPGTHAIAVFVYFSFGVLTTSAFGDIVPVDPFARSAANLESVIGMLFPATLLARLVSLQLESRRAERE